MVICEVITGVAAGPVGLSGSSTTVSNSNVAPVGRTMVLSPCPLAHCVVIICGVPSIPYLSIAKLLSRFAENMASCSEHPPVSLILSSSDVT